MSENHSTTNDDTIPTTGSGLMTRLGNISEAVLELLTDPQLRRYIRRPCFALTFVAASALVAQL